MSIIQFNLSINFPRFFYLGYSKDSQKTVNQYRSTGRFEQSKEAEAVVNAKYQYVQYFSFS